MRSIFSVAKVSGKMPDICDMFCNRKRVMNPRDQGVSRKSPCHPSPKCSFCSDAPWSPPSPALRRLGELQTTRAGLVGSLTEWKNRSTSGLADAIDFTDGSTQLDA